MCVGQRPDLGSSESHDSHSCRLTLQAPAPPVSSLLGRGGAQGLTGTHRPLQPGSAEPEIWETAQAWVISKCLKPGTGWHGECLGRSTVRG